MTGRACVLLRLFLNEFTLSLYFDVSTLKIILAALGLQVLRDAFGFLLIGLLKDTFFNCPIALRRLDIQRNLQILAVSLTSIAPSFPCLLDDLPFCLISCSPSRSLLPSHLVITCSKTVDDFVFFDTAYSLSLLIAEGSWMTIFDDRSSFGSVFMFLLLTAEASGDLLSDKIDGELGIGSKGMNLDDYVFFTTGLEGSFLDSSTFSYCFTFLLLQFLKTVDNPIALVLQFLLSFETAPSLPAATTSVGFSWTQVEASSLTLPWNTSCLLFTEGLLQTSDVFSYFIALICETSCGLALLAGLKVGSLDLLDQFLWRGGGGLIGVSRGSSPLGRVKIGLKPSLLAVTRGSEMLERMEGVVSIFLSAGTVQGKGRTLLFLVFVRTVSSVLLFPALLASFTMGRMLFLVFISIFAGRSFYVCFKVMDVYDLSFFSMNFNSLVRDFLLSNLCTEPLLLLSDKDSFLLGFTFDCEEFPLFLLRVFLIINEPLFQPCIFLFDSPFINFSIFSLLGYAIGAAASVDLTYLLPNGMILLEFWSKLGFCYFPPPILTLFLWFDDDFFYYMLAEVL